MYEVHIPYADTHKARGPTAPECAHCLLQAIIGGQPCGMETQTLESHDHMTKWESCLLWKFGIWKHGIGLHGQ